MAVRGEGDREGRDASLSGHFGAQNVHLAHAVTIPGMEGDLTAMTGHAPFLTTPRPGFVIVRSGNAETRYFVTGGFAEISQDVRVQDAYLGAESRST